MKKATLTLRDYFFIAAGVIAIVCMFLNWFPVDLDLGIIQIDEVLGKINAFTFVGTIQELEDGLGVWVSVLPETYKQVKIWSAVLFVLAVVTVAAYISAIVLRILRNDKYVNALSVAASVFAAATSFVFFSIASDIYDFLNITAHGYKAIDIVVNSPCAIVVLAAIVSAVFTEPVTEVMRSIVASATDTIVSFVMCVVAWVKLIVNNIGYVVSDIVGAFAGVCVAGWLRNLTNSALLAVLAGLAAAGIVAIACMAFVCCVILKNKKPILE